MPTLNHAQPPSATRLNNSGIEMNFIMARPLLSSVTLNSIVAKDAGVTQERKKPEAR